MTLKLWTRLKQLYATWRFHKTYQITDEGRRLLEYLKQLRDPDHYIISGYDEILEQFERENPHVSHDFAIDAMIAFLTEMDERGK